MDYSTDELGNFKWSVSASREIKASAECVWSAISKPGNLEDCHPFCEKNPVYDWPGVGSRDAVYYYSGWILQREFKNSSFLIFKLKNNRIRSVPL